MWQDKDAIRNSNKKTSISTRMTHLDTQTQPMDKKKKKKQPQKPKNKLKKALSQGNNSKISSSSNNQQFNQNKSNLLNDTYKFRLNISNLGAHKNGIFCCNLQPSKQMVIVYIYQLKQMEVKNIKQSSTLYYFNFDTINIQISKSNHIKNQFLLNITDHLILKFENIDGDKNNQNIQIFLKLLQNIIYQSMGNKYKMQSIKQQPDFYKNKYKSAIEFTQKCSTGDIILFCGQQLHGKIQRFFTNSEYDHVGMIYKDVNYGGVYILQSNSQPGTRFTKWEFILKYKWYSSMDKIVWRKLQGVQKDALFRRKMYNLMVNKIGKEYHISLDKLFSNQSYIYNSASTSSLLQDKSKNVLLKPQILKTQQYGQQKSVSRLKVQKKKGIGFFCSQLIAVMYKDMNLLTRDSNSKFFKPSCNYLPYHFSQKFDLHLLQGHLSQQYIINFNQNAINDCFKFRGDSS